MTISLVCKLFRSGLVVSSLLVLPCGLVACGSDSDQSPDDADAAADALVDGPTQDQVIDTDSQVDASSDSVDPDGADPDAAPDVERDAKPDAEPEAKLGSALFLGSDYADFAEVIAYDIKNKKVLGNLVLSEQDSLISTDQGRGFVLERPFNKMGRILILKQDRPWEIDASIDLGDKVTPYTAVVPSNSKAYVVMYASNELAVVDLQTKNKTGEIDLSEFVDAADDDGLVEPVDAVFDPSTNRAYILLQRTNLTWKQTTTGQWALLCNTVKPLIVGVDTLNDKLIDLNGDAPGKAVELQGFNPSLLQWNASKNNLIVAHSGCADAQDAPKRLRRGLERIDLDDMSTQWLWTTEEQLQPKSIISISDKLAAVQLTNDKWESTWHKLDIATKTVDLAPWSIPVASVYDGSEALIGLGYVEGDNANLAIVRYDLTTQKTTVLTEKAFSKGKPNDGSLSAKPL